MADPDLTRTEWTILLSLVEGKKVSVGDHEGLVIFRTIEKKLLDYLSGPGLDLGGE